jgi:hypothetical protein
MFSSARRRWLTSLLFRLSISVLVVAFAGSASAQKKGVPMGGDTGLSGHGPLVTPPGDSSIDNNSWDDPLGNNRWYANPTFANPTYGNPTYGNPTYGNPTYVSPPPPISSRER